MIIMFVSFLNQIFSHAWSAGKEIENQKATHKHMPYSLNFVEKSNGMTWLQLKLHTYYLCIILNTNYTKYSRQTEKKIVKKKNKIIIIACIKHSSVHFFSCHRYNNFTRTTQTLVLFFKMHHERIENQPKYQSKKKRGKKVRQQKNPERSSSITNYKAAGVGICSTSSHIKINCMQNFINE